MNNENFEEWLFGNKYLKGETRGEKLKDLSDRVIYAIISSSGVLDGHNHVIEDINFEHDESSTAFFFSSLTKEMIKIIVKRKKNHKHEINGIKINVVDGETISIWTGKVWVKT